MVERIIELLQKAPVPTQKEHLKEHGKDILEWFWEYMQKSDFLKPIDEWETLNDYIKHIAKEENPIDAFISLLK